MTWVPDGSDLITIEGDVVRCANARGSPGNAMWKDGDGLKTGEAYWEIHFITLEEGAFVGVVTPEKFKPGWGISCLSYGGNLSDGSGLLVSEFGPRFNANDTVGILASFEGKNLKIYFYYNNTPLGLAFDVPADCMQGGVHPCVKFSRAGTARCKKGTPPNKRVRQSKTYSGIEGPWKLQSLNPAADVHNVIVKFAKQEGETYGGHLKVVNGIMFQVSNIIGRWKASGGASTLMMGPPELMNLEHMLSDHVLNPENIEVHGDQLHIQSGNLNSVWMRYDDSPRAYVGNPFHH